MSDEKLLISFDDMTPLRGFEKRQEIYFVFLGYQPGGNADSGGSLAENDNELLDRFIPDHAELKKWFYMGASPVLSMRKKHKHVFPGGYPIYYDVPEDLVSFYVAIMESDQGSRAVGEILQQVFGDDNNKQLTDQVLDLLGAGAYKPAFSLAIKALEVVLLNNKDDMRYSNVWTFRKSEDYLAGTHSDWGNQRIAFTVDSDWEGGS